MRRLLYVPIIHSEADLGSISAALVQTSIMRLGEQRWATHKETVCKFWSSVAAFLSSLDPSQLRIYQDGLATDGEVGRRIVEEAARRGSKNYQLVLELLNKGAGLRKTESPDLLIREHENVLALAQEESTKKHQRVARRYRLVRDSLMKERDKFIADNINATLKEGELGVLFIGAYHNVIPCLATDISVEAVKDPQQMVAYFGELFLGQNNDRFAELTQYLRSPIMVS